VSELRRHLLPKKRKLDSHQPIFIKKLHERGRGRGRGRACGWWGARDGQ